GRKKQKKEARETLPRTLPQPPDCTTAVAANLNSSTIARGRNRRRIPHRRALPELPPFNEENLIWEFGKIREERTEREKMREERKKEKNLRNVRKFGGFEIFIVCDPVGAGASWYTCFWPLIPIERPRILISEISS
ncbi:hypothetical protein L195_g052463, partial [Trifolium pratense]